MQSFSLANHEDSLLPDGNWKLVWNDEFDGTELDRSKWDYRLTMMGKRHPAWTEKGVYLDGHSNAVFTILEEDGRPVSSQLQTGYNFMDEPVVPTKNGKEYLQWTVGKLHRNLFTHTYGYYECRCRLQQRTDAWWSAFWIQSPVIGASLDPADTGTEIDIMECFHSGGIVPHNAFTGGYGLDCKRAFVGGRDGLDQKAFHRFGLLWDENGYTFYIDGVEDGHISEYVSKRPEFILISTEVKGYRLECHQALPPAFDAVGQDDFLVDYVRVFDRV
ncbi:MAG: glycoside hydrolase family 16 protein [Victivallales bacterium]|nr:glycoside hydrolase family 16 protein [Victivallales bacterium]